MIITQTCNLDFAIRGNRQAISVVQGDCGSRVLELTLLEKGQPWNLPAGANVSLRYQKSDGTGGMYDTLPDGITAWSATDNRVCLTLAPQLMSIPGHVDCQLMIMQEEKYLGSFSFSILVEPDPSVDAVESEGYWNWSKFIQGPSAYAVAVANGFEGDEAAWLDSLVGPMGPQGVQGVQGNQGPQGVQGVQGAQGEPGRTPQIWLAPNLDSVNARIDFLLMSDLVGSQTPTLDSVKPDDLIICGKDGGVLYVKFTSSAVSGGAVVTKAGANASTNDQDGAAVYLTGPAGQQGEKGDSGISPNLSIGTVTTLDAGSDATAEITGQSPDLTLNLGIPKGADGSGGGGSADWSVNDETAAGYVKNRTHWKKAKYTHYLKEGLEVDSAAFSLSDKTAADGTALYVYSAEADDFPEAGDAVKTTWDGFDLTRTAVPYVLDGTQYLAFGNMAIIDPNGHDSGETYVTLCSKEKGTYTVYTTSAAASHSIKQEWEYRYASILSKTYRLEGANEHTLELGKMVVTPGETYEFKGLRDPNVTSFLYTAEIDEEASGCEFVNASGALVAKITVDANSNAVFWFDATALGCPSLDGAVVFSVTTKDPEQMYEWHKLEEGYLPRSVQTLIRSGGGRADWEAQEGESGYILNKPFGYAITELYSVSDEQFGDYLGAGIIGNRMDEPIGLTDGKEYTVTWDGVQYKCAASIVDGAETLGNMLFVGGPDTGEPFLYMGGNTFSMFLDINATAGTTHSITVEGYGVKKIPVTYLQNSNWLQDDSEKAGYIENKPFGVTWLGEYYFDGVLEGKTMVQYGQADSEGNEVYYVKVPDEIERTYDLCIKDPTERDVYYAMEPDYTGTQYNSIRGHYFATSKRNTGTIIAYWANVSNVTSELLGITFPEMGVYLRITVNNGNVVEGAAWPVYGYTRLNQMYLPDPLFKPVDYIHIRSSTPGSVKTFKLTITDDGVVKVV